MAGEDASPERLHGQSVELTQPTRGCRVATRLPQRPSLQSRGPQLLVDCLCASAGDAQAMLEGFPVLQHAGRESRVGFVGQGGELVG